MAAFDGNRPTLKSPGILLPSQRDIMALDFQPADVIGAVEQALTEHSNGN